MSDSTLRNLSVVIHVFQTNKKNELKEKKVH